MCFRQNSWLIAAIVLALALVCFPSSRVLPDDKLPKLRFIGEVQLPTEFKFSGTQVGGLSGIDYDKDRKVFYALSDDRSEINPARFYTLTIDLSDGSLDAGDVAFTKVTTLLDVNGRPFAPGSVDPESIRFDPLSSTLYWTNEGDTVNLVNPAVREMALDGRFIRELEIPDKFLPTADGSSGIRDNMGFESLTFWKKYSRLLTAPEAALIQDGPRAAIEGESPIRILELNVASGKPRREFGYVTDSAAAEPIPSNRFNNYGLVEMLSFEASRFLMLERSFLKGFGNAIKIFLAKFGGKSKDSISKKGKLPVMDKELVLDLAILGIKLDNIEGMTFGPGLPSGERSLILVSDNNFNPFQFTQFLAFALE